MALINEANKLFVKGCSIINDCATMKPYLMGPKISMLDIFLRHSLAIPTMVGPKLANFHPMEAIQGLDQWQIAMAKVTSR